MSLSGSNSGSGESCGKGSKVRAELVRFERQLSHFFANMFSLRAVRVLPTLRAVVRPTSFKAFSTSVSRFSVPEPIITGEGGKDGEVPTDLDQATGLERFELLYKLRGEEAFSTASLEVIRMGTLVDPISVFSLVSFNFFYSFSPSNHPNIDSELTHFYPL
jgi:hypothetical protein